MKGSFIVRDASPRKTEIDILQILNNIHNKLEDRHYLVDRYLNEIADSINDEFN